MGIYTVVAPFASPSAFVRPSPRLQPWLYDYNLICSSYGCTAVYGCTGIYTTAVYGCTGSVQCSTRTRYRSVSQRSLNAYALRKAVRSASPEARLPCLGRGEARKALIRACERRARSAVGAFTESTQGCSDESKACANSRSALLHECAVMRGWSGL